MQKKKLYVGTRKGLLTFVRAEQGWRQESTSFLASPVTMLLPDPRDGSLYAALRLGHYGVKLHRSNDGDDWQEISTPSFPASDEADAPSVDQIWSLECGGGQEAGMLWAGTLPGALYRSTDHGDSWALVESLWNRPERKSWFGGGYDDPGIHSICVDPRDPRCLTVGVSCGGVWHSRDSGASWELRTQGLWAAYMPPDQKNTPEIQDPHRIASCASQPDVLWCQHHNGVFVSRDRGMSWSECEDIQPSNFGFAVAVHPENPDIAWLAPAVSDECRVPVDLDLVVTRTHDGGKSFDILSEDLPNTNAFDLIFRHCLEVDDTGETLAMGSTTGGLWISENGGDSWATLSQNLPPIYCLRFAG